MEKWKKRAIDLITSVAFGSDDTPSVIPYYPQKTECAVREERYFQRHTPESHGVSSKRIYNMLCELEGERRANVHSIMVLKDGCVISEASRPGYSSDEWHLSHSMSKTVTGMAVGLAVDDGVLDTDERLVDIFPEIPYKDKKFAKITVEHLLSMTAGASFSEMGTVTETDWTAAFFSSSMKFAPGEGFLYNSMNSYILGRIVTERMGRELLDIVYERIFAPLGIKSYFWERGPEGYTKGGWGLYLSLESWAKLGEMMRLGGVFEGRRILSKEWVRFSTDTRGVSPHQNGDFNYGYQVWVGRTSDEILFNGMLGQNVWICPKNNMVVVLTAGNNELFQKSPALDIVRKYLGHKIYDPLVRGDVKVLRAREERFFESRRWAHPCEEKRGIACFLGLKSRTPFPEVWAEMLGSYALPDNNLGVLPLFVRAMQNNLDSRLSEIRLERRGDSLYLSFVESGEEYSLEVGLYGYKESVLDFRGEKYTVRVMGDAVFGTVGVPEYRIELVFPELPNTRMIKLTRMSRERIRVELTESPNNRIIDPLLDRIPEESAALGFIVELLERRFGKGFISARVEKTFAHTLVAADMCFEGYPDIVAAEGAKLSRESRAVTLLRAFVNRFIREDTPVAQAAMAATDEAEMLAIEKGLCEPSPEALPTELPTRE